MNEDDSTIPEQLEQVLNSVIEKNNTNYYNQTITTAGNTVGTTQTVGGNNSGNWQTTVGGNSSGLQSWTTYPPLVSVNPTPIDNNAYLSIYRVDEEPVFMCCTCLKQHSYTKLRVLNILNHSKYSTTPRIDQSFYMCSEACVNIFISKHPL